MTPAEMARLHAAAFTRQRPWAAAEFEGLLADAATRIVVLPGGFGLLRLVPPDAEILTLAVDPQDQRRGIGRALVRDLIDCARNGGADRLLLEVALGNAAARALYEKAGFAEIGRRPRYYRYPAGGTDDAIVLALDLA